MFVNLDFKPTPHVVRMYHYICNILDDRPASERLSLARPSGIDPSMGHGPSAPVFRIPDLPTPDCEIDDVLFGGPNILEGPYFAKLKRTLAKILFACAHLTNNVRVRISAVR